MEAQTVINAGAMLEGTARYRARFKDVAAEDHFRQPQNLWLSSIGIGTYLGEANEECDRRYAEAIVCAVELGVNVIDTAANYRFQRSERSVGAALKELIARGFARDEIVVCTKGGRSEEHTSELQSPCNLVCRLLLEKKKKKRYNICYDYLLCVTVTIVI